VATEADKASAARREFLRGAAALAGTLVAPGIFLYQTGQATAALQAGARWGLLIDNNALDEADVDACVDACRRENGWRAEPGSTTDAQWIRKLELTDRETGYRSFLPLMCLHCESPPCVDVCPTGASFKRADGIVLVNKHTCIGCRYCMMACPYKARSFIHEKLDDQLPRAPRGKGTVESCTLCVHRIDRDGADAVPACAEAVNRDGRKAILFGDLNDPESEISRRLREVGGTRLRADMGLDPAVRYLGL
jgi:molybdopterin-containing oxidoreductase family iron-sulfur binding subunit